VVKLSDGAGPTATEIAERPAFLDAGKRLFGIVSEPAHANAARTGVMLLNAGAVSRIGPHRFYVSLAREWASAGFRVLRMDIGGIGDSLPANGAKENETYPKAATADITAGLDALRQMGAEKVVVVGLCSGAHGAYHLALDRGDRADLAGVVMINPIVFYWKPGDALDISTWQNYSDTRRLTQVVRTREAWAKLLKGQVDVSHVAHTFVRRLITVTAAAIERIRAQLNLSRPEDDLAGDLLKLTERPLDVAMVFSNGDPGYDQLTLHAKHVLGALQQRPNFSIAVVPDADHTFTPIDSQKRVRQVLFDHLKTRFA
jgi:pimeloyl-ACP methyl ester carboxylesterase